MGDIAQPTPRMNPGDAQKDSLAPTTAALFRPALRCNVSRAHRTRCERRDVWIKIEDVHATREISSFSSNSREYEKLLTRSERGVG